MPPRNRNKNKNKQQVDEYASTQTPRAEPSFMLPGDSTVARIPPTLVTLEDIKGNQSFKFECELHERDYSNVFDCISPQGLYNMSAIGCAHQHEALDYFQRYSEHGGVVFGPLLGYWDSNNRNVILFGSKVGNSVNAWITANESNLWVTHPKDNKKIIKPGPILQRVGLQMVTFMTKLHQKGKYIGNLSKGLSFDPNNSDVMIPLLKTHKSVPEGIKQDLIDFRSFMKGLVDHFKKKGYEFPRPSDYDLFDSLFPTPCAPYYNEYPKKLDEIQELSYIICHAPIFWRLKESYLFSRLGHGMYNKKRELLIRCANLVDGLTNIGNWQDEITNTPNHALQMVWSNAYKTKSYSTPISILAFNRNSLDHDDGIHTQEEMYEKLQGLSNAIFSKIYCAICKGFLLNGKDFVGELKNGLPVFNYAV